MNPCQSNDPAVYAVPASTAADDAAIARALEILGRRLSTKPAACFESPAAVKQYLTLHAGRRADQAREVFAVMFLDAQHRLIEVADLFTGTLMQTSVYPREVVRAALARNAAAVILTHNHPSGVSTPSRADEHLTQSLKAALALVDVRVLDHIVTAGAECTSFAERGLI